MKTRIVVVGHTLLISLLLTGCLNLQLGGGTSNKPQAPTTGQQLIDLQRAKEAGAISDAEYQAARTKLLGHP